MSKEQTGQSIADDATPNMGRIYDYLLGGNHNFEVDRTYAAKLLKEHPLTPKIARLIRWFLNEAIHRQLNEGITQFIDFASGLPVQDHIHNITPPGTRVIYSDLDPVTVAYAAEILGDTPDVLYLRCDVADPSQILDTDTVSTFFDRNRKVSIGLNGITYFMENESLRHTLEVLYNWAKEGDRLYLCDSPERMRAEKGHRMYAQIGNPLHWHSPEQMSRLVGSWKLVPPGYLPLEEWLRIDGTPVSVSEEERQAYDANCYGAFFEK